MAITYTDNGGGAANGSDLEFTFTFPVIQTEDVKVALNGVTQATTKYAVDTASNPTKITFNNTSVDSSVQESTGAPKSGVRVRVYRETTVGKSTGDDDPKAVFAAGSSIRATDLNANVEQALYAIHELQNRPIETEDIQDLAVTSSKIEDGTIVNADVNASAAIAGTKIAPDFGSQNIATTGTVNDVTTTELSILDGATVSTAELNILDGATITTAELNSLDGFTGNVSELNTLDGVTASTAELNKLDGVTATTTELNILDGVTASTTEINKLDGVTASTAELNLLDGVTATTAELNKLDGFTGTTANLNSISGLTANVAELNLLDGVTATTAELNLNDGQTATPTEVNILDGATVSTTELNKLDGYTGSTADLNEVVAGKNVVETISGTATDAQIPTAQAVNERVVELVTEVGGFHPIANETSFPSTNPDINDGAGTIVSIKALSSAFTTGSGVTTKVFTNGAGSGVNVTVNGLTQSTTYPAGRGMLLETTSTLHTYNFHRLTLDETGVAAAQAAIDDWDERYYGPLGSAPSTRPGGGSRVQGDLYFSTADNQMKVWNNAASQWDDVASSASSNIVTLTPAFNNSETEFTCSTVPVDAQSLLLSINGVIQKPNSGTSTPSEGYVKLTNGKIKLASAPATGSSYFAIALGNTVSVGTPSPNTVGATELKTGEIANTHISSSAAIAKSKLASLDIVNADVNASAAIAGSKLADDSISLAKLEHGTSSNNGKFLRANNGADPTFESVITDLVNDSSPQLGGNLDSNTRDIHLNNSGDVALRWQLSGTNKWSIFHNTSGSSNHLEIFDNNGSKTAAKFITNGAAELYHSNAKKLETTSWGVLSGGYIKSEGSSGKFILDDNGKFEAGDSGDLKLFHDGSNSHIKSDTNALIIRSDALRINNNGNTETMIKADVDGAVELYHGMGGSAAEKKLETSSTGVKITGNDATGSENYGSITYKTASGTVRGFFNTTNDRFEFKDNFYSTYGNTQDLQIYHAGDHSYISDTGTGQLRIRSNDLRIQDTSGNAGIQMLEGGAVYLYHSGSQKFETTSTGTSFSNGTAVFNGPSGTAYTAEIKPTNGNPYGLGVTENSGANAGYPLFAVTSNAGATYFRTLSGGISEARDLRPVANNTYDLGTSSVRWRNIYTNDLHLSNEGGANDVDSTWGDWTIQEGESDLFLKNNRSGKKYKFNLTEVS